MWWMWNWLCAVSDSPNQSGIWRGTRRKNSCSPDVSVQQTYNPFGHHQSTNLNCHVSTHYLPTVLGNTFLNAHVYFFFFLIKNSLTWFLFHVNVSSGELAQETPMCLSESPPLKVGPDRQSMARNVPDIRTHSAPPNPIPEQQTLRRKCSKKDRTAQHCGE